MKNRGMLTLAELDRRVEIGEIDTVLVAFTDHYGRLMGKRYDAEFFLESAAKDGAHACDYLLTVDMGMNPVPGYKFANWERGYGDVHLVPDLATLRVASWLDRSALVLCDVHDVQRHEPVTVAPRSILRRQLERAAKLGFTAQGASELEYYVFANSYKQAAQQDYRGLEPAGWHIEDYHMLQGARGEPLQQELRRHLRESGVPVENSKGEWGKGQHELNVRYTELLEMADRHVVYKQCAKELADRLGMSVTFMAKLDGDQAGSSCHVHLSLWSGGKNAFAGEQQLGPVRCSDTFRWFLGGWMAHTADVMPFYAPTVNSYKRYQSGSWAPTRLAWSHDNRTAGFRIVGHGQSLRIECRIPGADCNPYLCFAAALASGLDGVENRTEPPPMFEGDVYHADSVETVPQSLGAATVLFAKGEFATRAFGADVVEHYAHHFRAEGRAFQTAVTDWERRRYFEQI
ncbi:MAG: glutamine synthetase family protein [Planctomycetota bacterium]